MEKNSWESNSRLDTGMDLHWNFLQIYRHVKQLTSSYIN